VLPGVAAYEPGWGGVGEESCSRSRMRFEQLAPPPPPDTWMLEEDDPALGRVSDRARQDGGLAAEIEVAANYYACAELATDRITPPE